MRSTLTGKNLIIPELFLELYLLGLPFTAFVEAFFLLSQRKFPNASNLLESVTQLVNICTRHLNLTLDAPIIPLTTSSATHRTVKNTSHSSLHIRPNISALRSSTTTSIHRSGLITPSTDQLNSSMKTTDDKTKPKLSIPPTKSVFPLFFDVL